MLDGTAHGRIGRDAELRFTPNGTAVVELAIGCNYGMKGESGYKPTQWLRAAIWGNLAEALAPYLLKGKGVVAIVKDIHEREFEKNDGTKGTSLEATVVNIEFTGAGPREEPAQAPVRTPPTQRPATAPKQSTGFDDMDDDIPF